MKILSGILIAVFSLHLGCGGSCLAESSKSTPIAAAPVTEAPPCHQSSNAPVKTPEPAHGMGTPCDQGLLIQTKLSIDGARLLLAPVSIGPVAVAFFGFDKAVVTRFEATDPPVILSLHRSFSILRI